MGITISKPTFCTRALALADFDENRCSVRIESSNGCSACHGVFQNAKKVDEKTVEIDGIETEVVRFGPISPFRS